MTFDLRHGDAVEVLRGLAAGSVDAIVTDPPYGLEFLGKEWDRLESPALMRERRAAELGDPVKAKYLRHSVEYVVGAAAGEWHLAWAREALRVLKPGGYLLAFGGTRTYHRLGCAIEDAGFEIRDCLAWLYGSGFPKSHDVSKALDRAAGAAREPDDYTGPNLKNEVYGRGMGGGQTLGRGAPVTAAAIAYQGWGTALKPAHEPIVLARKPLVGTVAENVLAHGTGGLNIDGTRVGTEQLGWGGGANTDSYTGFTGDPDRPRGEAPPGRWPANVLLDEEAARMLDAQAGVERGAAAPVTGEEPSGGAPRFFDRLRGQQAPFYGDTGGASRFFYTAKSSAGERHYAGKNPHPTVKPVDLMRWLCRLVTPRGGLVLDPFMGSGSTGIAALSEGFRFLGVEREAEYVEMARRRIAGPLFAAGAEDGEDGEDGEGSGL